MTTSPGDGFVALLAEGRHVVRFATGPGGLPDWVVADSPAVRVTLDARVSLDRALVRDLAGLLLRVGAAPAGPVPSETVAPDLFLHELARQDPDVLLLVRPAAGDRLRSILRYVSEARQARPLHILYCGPAASSHQPLTTAPGCTYQAVTRDGLEPALEGLVRQTLASRLASRLPLPAAGDTRVFPLGMVAARAARRLARRLGVEVALVLVEPEWAAAFVPQGDRVEAGSVGLTGTGTLDLARPSRGPQGSLPAEGWMPEGAALARNLPADTHPTDAANLAATGLGCDGDEAGLPSELVHLAASLVVETLRRLGAEWSRVYGKDAHPARARLLIGTGSGLRRLGDPGLAASALVRGLEPGGVTLVAVDLSGDLLVGEAGRQAGLLREEPGFPPLAAVVVSPLAARQDWRRGEDRPWAVVSVTGARGTVHRRLFPGRVAALPLPPGETVRLRVEPCSRRLDFGKGPGRPWDGEVPGSPAGVVLDGLGRPLVLPDDPVLRVAKTKELLAAFGVRSTLDVPRPAVSCVRPAPAAADPTGVRVSSGAPEGSPAPVPLVVRRPVPAGATVCVAPGDAVRAETPLAQGHLSRRVLRLPPAVNFELLKGPGDPVKAGEAVAVAEEFFGLALRELVSPVDGVVESVGSRRTSLVLAGTERSVTALVPGRVTDVNPGEVGLEVTGWRLQGRFGFGRPVAAPLHRAGELDTEAGLRHRLGPEVQGTVVLADSYVLPRALPLLAGYGAAGLICGGLDFDGLWSLVAPDGPYPGGRGLPTTVVLGGFGEHRVPEEALGLLSGAAGRLVYLAAPSPDRLVFAGPPWPEIVVVAGHD
ncbi:MAG: hypothetical protein K6U08_00700 [Firmicutes bacterium]|nr:hypothetical protein [Bacillota bacterium]